MLKSVTSSYNFLFHYFKLFLATLSPLHVHRNFRISLSISTHTHKNVCWNFDWDYTGSMYQFGEKKSKAVESTTSTPIPSHQSYARSGQGDRKRESEIKPEGKVSLASNPSFTFSLLFLCSPSFNFSFFLLLSLLSWGYYRQAPWLSFPLLSSAPVSYVWKPKFHSHFSTLRFLK